MTVMWKFSWLQQRVIISYLLPVCLCIYLAMTPLDSFHLRRSGSGPGNVTSNHFTNHTTNHTTSDIWQILAQVSWPDDDSFRPHFSEPIKKLNGSVVTIGGFLVPTDVHGAANAIILSAYPVQSCFFCGGARLESVVEIYPSRKTDYLMKKLTFRGTLVLNDHDPGHLLYQLKNAERIFEED